jgi:hypothetical protein
MKTKKLSKKLMLNKTSIVDLQQLREAKGKGGETFICHTIHQLADCPYWTDEPDCPWPDTLPPLDFY